MGDPLVKRIEIGFRRWLVRVLRFLFTRPRRPVENIDFNRSKFLFVRQDMIGDVLVSTPLLAALHDRYPGARIDALLSNKNHFVLERDPAVTKRWVYKKNLSSAVSILRNIRRERYDFIIDLMDNPSATSTVVCLLAGARWNVGIEKENDYAYDIVVPMLSRRDTHIIDRIAQLLTPFRISPSDHIFAIRYVTSPDSDRFAEGFIKTKLPSGRPIVGLNISAGSEVRYWGTRNFSDFISWVTSSHPECIILILHKPSDRDKAQAIHDLAPSAVVSPDTTSFDQFAALIRRLAMLLTPDTSAVHLASAFNVPVVVLYVQSDKSLRIWEPYGTEYEILVTEKDDLSTIPASDVTTAFERLYERTRISGKS
ncbi:MAG: glycosyltransferase family 9 protein [Bacteroidota bacterium]